jgi:tetratricopeptide (TPR) repeat protein
MNRNLVRISLLAAAVWIAILPGSLPAGGNGYPAAYTAALAKAFDCFHTRDFVAAARYLDEADRAVPQTPPVLNARGAIAIEKRHFEEGAKYCIAALEKDPQFFLARFNLGEIPFMQKRYAEARPLYEEVLAAQPSNELVQYRIFLTYLLEKNDATAQESLARIRYPGDTGAYYYAHAAWEFAHGNATEAMRWINAGDWIFSKVKNVYLADPLVDLGWLKRNASRVSSAE